MAKAFSSVTSENTKKAQTKSLPKPVTNPSLAFKTTGKNDLNVKKSNSSESKNLQSELCQKCRRGVDRYSKCSVGFNFRAYDGPYERINTRF